MGFLQKFKNSMNMNMNKRNSQSKLMYIFVMTVDICHIQKFSDDHNTKRANIKVNILNNSAKNNCHWLKYKLKQSYIYNLSKLKQN